MENEAEARKEKAARMRMRGDDPYPPVVERKEQIGEVIAGFEGFEKSGSRVAVCGRLKTLRAHGGLTFGHLQDESGTIQIAFRRDTVGIDAYRALQKDFDIGDFLSVSGTAFVTKVGEQTIDVASYRMIVKALRPLPEKWHGLVETETR